MQPRKFIAPRSSDTAAAPAFPKAAPTVTAALDRPARPFVRKSALPSVGTGAVSSKIGAAATVTAGTVQNLPGASQPRRPALPMGAAAAVTSGPPQDLPRTSQPRRPALPSQQPPQQPQAAPARAVASGQHMAGSVSARVRVEVRAVHPGNYPQPPDGTRWPPSRAAAAVDPSAVASLAAAVAKK